MTPRITLWLSLWLSQAFTLFKFFRAWLLSKTTCFSYYINYHVALEFEGDMNTKVQRYLSFFSTSIYSFRDIFPLFSFVSQFSTCPGLPNTHRYPDSDWVFPNKLFRTVWGSSNQRPVSRSRDLCGPIRDQYCQHAAHLLPLLPDHLLPLRLGQHSSPLRVQAQVSDITKLLRVYFVAAQDLII